MQVVITIKADLNVDGWATEYGHPSSAVGLTAAIKEALTDLREREYYLTEAKWSGLVSVTDVKARGVF